ncbi:MAG: hypothetical protein HY535_03975 [Chloroflexi bacterium]|nr:hypothetical protein [Chloroflexota bacterium]
MRCPSCGSGVLDPQAAYCAHCGKALSGTPEPRAAEVPGGLRCYRHPDAVTVLTCGHCERPICVRCVVQHPVGIRCPECAQQRRLPTFDVRVLDYAKAIGVALAGGLAGVVGVVLALGLVGSRLAPVAYYLSWAILVAVGYGIGTAINWAVNRKRSRGLQWIAGAGVVATFTAASLLTEVLLTAFFPMGLLALALAIYLAASKLRM